MTPAYQQIICPHRGDCMSACIATLLDLPIDQVPKWSAEEYDNHPDKERAFREMDQHYAMLRWLHARNYAFVEIFWNSLVDWRGLRGLQAIARVPSQSFPGIFHAVIIAFQDHTTFPGAVGWSIVHDPNQNNEPYGDDVNPVSVSLLVPHTYSR